MTSGYLLLIFSEYMHSISYPLHLKPFAKHLRLKFKISVTSTGGLGLDGVWFSQGLAQITRPRESWPGLAWTAWTGLDRLDRPGPSGLAWTAWTGLDRLDRPGPPRPPGLAWTAWTGLHGLGSGCLEYNDKQRANTEFLTH